ncbi:hypothetical protein [Arthrobacter sp. A2-55]|uniref:hypothetical protein n=1 Tax=Arthrobacter sp. A2-55 TaxID=2897337 RepID=UPI0021CD7AEF|nr:hypothetical protein [Arthrobacter sp. A2-55]MCU6481960.1 hypothetical protein [Arthrobacter sp. A2-55]
MTSTAAHDSSPEAREAPSPDSPTPEESVRSVLALADAWEARGEHDMEFSRSLPEDVAEAIHDGGADMVNKARLIRMAVAGKLTL